MKKIKIYSLLLIFSASILSSCANNPFPVPTGLVYNGGTMPGGVANNGVKPIKTGKACVLTILQLVSAGDGGIDAAKRDGKITKVATVDYDFMSILGVYGQYCTKVTGE